MTISELYVEHFLFRELIEVTVASIEPFSAHSPELDSLEECISKAKAYLRKRRADSVPALRRALGQAFEQVTLKDTRM